MEIIVLKIIYALYLEKIIIRYEKDHVCHIIGLSSICMQ
jgi:hypothetical protein